jgi:hypothetical protein
MLQNTTVDTTVTMAFLQRPEVFAGRALSTPPRLLESAKGQFPYVNPSSAKIATGYPESETYRPGHESPTHFPHRGSISLISRGVEFGVSPPDTTMIPAINNSLPSLPPKKIQFTTGLANKNSHLGAGTEEYFWVAKYSGITSVAIDPLDAENTILEIDGEQYILPNSELWLLSYEKDQVMSADRLAHMIRPTFFSNIEVLGALEAVEAVNGHRLEVMMDGSFCEEQDFSFS